MKNWQAILMAGLLGGTPVAAIAAAPPPDSAAARQEAKRLNSLPPVVPPNAVHVDHSGRKETGRGSYYAPHFTNRTMADGNRMNPNTNIAASKSLPLGSVAKVTNLDNGKTATVKIEDRGPYVKGRVVDVAPKVANQLEMKQQGTAPVEVKPITLPQSDESVKLGAGAAESSPQEIQEAVTMTKALTASRTTETAEK
jgi:peptidoglycan lytic transglycosylase